MHNQTVGHFHPMWLHGVPCSIVIVPYLWIIEVGHLPSKEECMGCHPAHQIVQLTSGMTKEVRSNLFIAFRFSTAAVQKIYSYTVLH